MKTILSLFIAVVNLLLLPAIVQAVEYLVLVIGIIIMLF